LCQWFLLRNFYQAKTTKYMFKPLAGIAVAVDSYCVTFRFNIRKATEVASLFIAREGGRLNVMKLVKLVYLLDRLSIAKRGIPVVGGVYYSMRNGPVTGELLDIINAGKLANDADASWEQYISDRERHEVALLHGEAPLECVSESEVQLLEAIYREHGQKDQWQIRDWCHANCGEWTSLQGGRENIQIEEIAVNVGKSGPEVQRISEEARESNLLNSAFSVSPLVYA
jgi:uncharacterized phage-associated protein